MNAAGKVRTTIEQFRYPNLPGVRLPSAIAVITRGAANPCSRLLLEAPKCSMDFITLRLNAKPSGQFVTPVTLTCDPCPVVLCARALYERTSERFCRFTGHYGQASGHRPPASHGRRFPPRLGLVPDLPQCFHPQKFRALRPLPWRRHRRNYRASHRVRWP